MKNICYLILLTFLLSQHTIQTREFIVYKTSDTHHIDLSDLLPFSDTNYILSLSNIQSFINNNNKKSIIEQCELKLTLSIENDKLHNKKVLFNTVKGVSGQLCNGQFSSEKSLSRSSTFSSSQDRKRTAHST